MSFGNSIGDLKNVLSTLSPTSEVQATPRPENASSKPALSSETKADETSLSPASGLVAQALGGSDVRTAKVEALRQAIGNGSYQIPSSEVAGKVIESLTK